MSDELKFRISSGLKNIIGRDLITDEYIAVFELVKNSFDAHSTEVEIIFENIFSKSGKITIIDNGKGMNYEDLINKWLFVAYSAKKDGSEDVDYRDKIKNRMYYAGAKGIGRFSCDKLGSNLRLISKKDELESKIEEIKVDWAKFEENAKDEFINVSVLHNELKEFPSKFSSGTILEISGLRPDSNWSADKIIRLKHSLAKLINPFESSNNRTFNITVRAPEFRKFDSEQTSQHNRINGLVRNNLLEILKNKTVKIKSHISEDGKFITTELLDNNNFLYRITEKNRDFILLHDVLIELYFVNRKAKNSFTRTMGIKKSEYGSVFLYKNNIRIYPFGEPHEDSWGLDLRQQKRIGDYVGTSELIGRVEITGENEEFKETTSRGDGLIKSASYYQLQDYFIKYVMPKLESYVMKFLKYGIDIKKYDNSASSLREIVRHISGFKGEDFEDLEYNPNILNIIGYSLNDSNSTSTVLNSIEKIAKQYEDDNLLSMVNKVRVNLEEALTIAEIAEGEVKEKDKIINEQTSQNLFLRSIKSQDFEEIVSFMHHIGISASNIENEIGGAYQEINRNGSIQLNELKSLFQFISLEMKKILSITRFATKANFKLFSEESEIDLIKYIEEYINHIIKPLRSENLNIVVNNVGLGTFVGIFRPLEISIVLDNLISNSFKANAKNVEINLISSTKEIEINYKDDGRGVNESIKDSLFDIGITTTPGGSGLGLYHIRKIIKDMGGEISLVSTKPATFKIILNK